MRCRQAQEFQVFAQEPAQWSVSAFARPTGFYRPVEFRGVGLTYRNAGAESLSNLNLKVKRGQTVGIIGGKRAFEVW